MSPAHEYQAQYFAVSFPVEYVALVEINRPEKLNAFKDVMWDEMKSTFATLSTDPNVRAVVLTGRGDRAFTAGLDVTAAAPTLTTPRQSDVAHRALWLRTHIHHIQSTVSALALCAKPVIAALHGYSYGAAIDISTAADVRLAASNTRLSVKETAIGLAADVGTLTRLPKVVGNMSWVKEVALTSREFGAEEAARVGFVSDVLPGGREEVVKKALEVAMQMVGNSPVAVQGTKRVIDYSRDRTTEDGLEYVAVWNGAMLQGADVPVAIESGLTKRRVEFAKL